MDKDKDIVTLIESDSETLSGSFGNGSIAYMTLKCADYSSNGDAIGLFRQNNRGGVLLLADGAGGTPGGNKASGLAIKETIAQLRSKSDAKLREKILNGFESANGLLLKQGTGACTTLFAVELNSNLVRPYYAGDSLIMVIGQRGKRKYHSIAHSPDGYATEAGVIGETEVLSKDSKYEVLNLVGSSDMRIEIGPYVELAPNDTLVICSDGVSDNLNSDQIAEILRKGDLVSSVRQLADESLKKMQTKGGKPDDLSIITYRPN